MHTFNKGLSGLMALIWAVTAFSVNAQSTDEFNLDKTYDIRENGTINLQSDDAGVTITGSDRDDVHVVVHYKLEVKGLDLGSHDRFEMQVEERDGDLVLREKPRDNDRFTIGITHESYTISILVPRSVDLKIKGDDDNYRLVGIDGAMDVKADDADLDIRDCNGKQYAFELDDGDFNMEGGSGKLRMELGDGDVTIRDSAFDEIQLETDDGDIEIGSSLSDSCKYQFTMDDAELTMNVTGGGGRFEIDHEDARITADDHFKKLRDEEGETVYSLPGGKAEVYVDTDDGRIRLRVF